MDDTPGKTVLASDLITVMDDLRIIHYRVSDIIDRYVDTGLSDEVTALADDTAPLTRTLFTKGTITEALAVLQAFDDFMIADPLQVNTNGGRTTQLPGGVELPAPTTIRRTTVNKVAALKGE